MTACCSVYDNSILRCVAILLPPRLFMRRKFLSRVSPRRQELQRHPVGLGLQAMCCQEKFKPRRLRAVREFLTVMERVRAGRSVINPACGLCGYRPGTQKRIEHPHNRRNRMVANLGSLRMRLAAGDSLSGGEHNQHNQGARAISIKQSEDEVEDSPWSAAHGIAKRQTRFPRRCPRINA